MREKILKDLMAAIKNQEKDKLSVLRMVKGAMQLEEINNKKELDDNEMVSLISKQIKVRKESIADFEKGNRADLVEKTQKEIDILAEYMPEQMSDDEVVKIIDEVILENKFNTIADMGKVMKLLTPKLVGQADMSLVSKLVKEKLNSK